ncbi:MAG: outer membrane beta-barrel protein [Acidobacteriaceae bacterium]
MPIGTQSQTVTVEAAASVITTDTPTVAQTRTGLELNELPLAISSRASGSTSPYATLTSQPGVQTDSSGNISVAGSKPSLLSVTIDGISTMNVRSGAPSTELFPSFNSIEEIRISENSNAAEFSGVSDITTVSKSGTNRSHGGIFDNYETDGLNAKNPFSKVKPKLVMNDFGAFYSGPISIPHLYSGTDRSFYFVSYEGLRLPQQSSVVQSVPTAAMRNGDLSGYTSNQIYNIDGTPFANNQIPTSDISPVAAKALDLLYPLPNYGSAGATSNNYQKNFNTPITSDQGDIRIDQKITDKQSVYARFSYKQRAVIAAPSSSTSNGGSALIGTFNQPEKDTSLTVAYNYILSPNLLNEFRAGLSKYVAETTFNANSSLVGSLGISGIPDLPSSSVAASPNFAITGFTATGGRGSNEARSRIFQFTDSLTWTHGMHTVKIGADYRRLFEYSSNVFGSIRLGKYSFTGGSAVGKRINAPFASFLLGVPDTTRVGDVLAPDSNGAGNMYSYYVQDDWRILPSLTLSYGLRYEYHPVMQDEKQNNAQFLPDYYSSVNGNLVRGAVIVPGQYALSHNVLQSFATGIAPLPILTAQQAGFTSALVDVSKDDFAPRIGFAWRPFNNNKTVLRGGFGRYIETAYGTNVIGGWAVSASAVNNYTNGFDSNNKPLLSFPSPFANSAQASNSGSLTFDYAVTPHYKDPTVQQWNLTLEQDLNFNTGLRISYTGSHGQDMAEQPDLNQIPYNTTGYSKLYASRPFPEFSTIPQVQNIAESNYHALTVELNHRYSYGLQFQSSYTFLRDLSDAAGSDPTGFATEGFSTPSDLFHPGLDYGNVSFSRRHRFLTSFLYDLPIGRGKMFLNNINPWMNKIIGGWQSAGYLLFQSGSFMTILADSSVDPTGSGININTVGNSRADIVPGVSPYLHGKGARNFLNPAAFINPENNIGRQGNSRVGSVVGPGTASVSASLMKSVSFTERLNLQLGAQVQNIFNHQNLDVPASLVVGTSNFGQISSVQSLDNAGPRSVALTVRMAF